MIRVEQNFDWAITNKKLAIYMSNFNGKVLTETSILKIIETIDKTKYRDDIVIIVGNDNINDDFSHLVDRNVFSFKLKRDISKPRNQGFIRNYFIKRTQSKYVLLKDGEVALEGNFINNCINFLEQSKLWRPGNVFSLSEVDTKKYIIERSINKIATAEIKHILPLEPQFKNVNVLKTFLIMARDGVTPATYWNYAFAVESELLKSINGYDEAYNFYGFEDYDLFCRLVAMNKYFTPDYESTAIHLWHPLTINFPELPKMRKLFKDSNPSELVRNPNYWGNGI